MAAAPSFKPEEFPAVTLPPFFEAGLSFANLSKVVSGFTNLSCEKILVLLFVEFLRLQFLELIFLNFEQKQLFVEKVMRIHLEILWEIL